MTKAAALALYQRAESSGDWEAAARALASVIRPAPRRLPTSIRRGPASKACPGIRLPLYALQPCGHSYNAAGCAACPYCAQARWAAQAEPLDIAA